MYRNIDRIEGLLNNIGQVLFRIDTRTFANIKKSKFETKPDSSFGFSSILGGGVKTLKLNLI